MVKRRKARLYPRSFLPTRELDSALKKEAVRRGMTYSQLIRHALVEWALYQQVQGMEQARLQQGEAK